MTVRTPLEEVTTTTLTNPSLGTTLFIVAQGGVEQSLTAGRAATLLGNKGDPGYTGSTGTQGVIGFTGSTGTQGFVGYTGSTGTQGLVGFTGSQGTTGYIGSRGYQGSTGTQGFLGYTGSRGIVGYTGSASTATGYSGSVGYTGSGGALSGTSTNIAGGVAGAIPMQRATSSTAFIAPGTTGNLLQSQGTTATFVSTSSLLISNSLKSEQSYVTILPVVGRTGDQYLTMVSGGTGYYGAGIQSNITYNPTSKLLSSPGIYVSSATIASSTITGALQVVGGVGIGGNIYAGGSVNIASRVDTLTTTTGALVVSGGVGIGQDLRVGGVIYGTISGSISSANSIAGGTAGQIPYQTNAGATSFFGPGAVGWLLSGNGTAAPVWKNTTTITVQYAVNVLGGAAGSVLYQSANNTTRSLGIGNPGEVLTVNPGGTAPYWTTVPTSGGGGAVDTSTTSTNLAGGLSGQVPYQISAGRTGFTDAGTVGQVLTSAGTGKPTWTSTSNITVNNATTSTDTSNIKGGAAGSLVYQSAPDVTAFLSIGSSGYVLVSNGSTPSWTSLSSISNVNTATNLGNGTTGQIPYQTGVGQTGFFGPGTTGQILVSNGTAGAHTFTNTSSIRVGYSANVIGGSTGTLVYQTSNDTTGFVGPGTLSQILVSQGAAAPQYTNTSSIRVGFAANLIGGSAGQIPYQQSSGITRFFGAGTTGQILVSDGTNGPYFTGPGTAGQLLVSQGAAAPQYTNTSSITVGFAAYAVLAGSVVNNSIGYASSSGYASDILGGTAGQLVYQSGVNSTAFVGPGSTGQILVSQGAATPQYTNTSSITVGYATALTNSLTIGTGLSGTSYNGSTAVTIANSGVTSAVAGTGVGVSGSTGDVTFSIGQEVGTSNNVQFNSLGVGTGASGTGGEIIATNEITAYYSDRRLKENVKVIDNAIEKVLKLNGITYTPNDLAESYGYDKTKKLVGLFADEVEAVLPEATRPAPFDTDTNGNSKSGENYKTIQYEKLVPLLIEAIKELANEVNNLKNEAGNRSL